METYQLGEPPTRTQLPETDARVISFNRGEGNAPVVTIDGEQLEHRIVYHSPDGFEFGYLGSGPADLALNILGLVLSEKEAFRLHQQFKFAILRSIDFHGGELTMTAVIEWIRGVYHNELTNPRTIEQEAELRRYWQYALEQENEYSLAKNGDPLGDEDPPAEAEPELAKPCSDAFCKECRTGENEEELFLENVARHLRRPLTDEEKHKAKLAYELDYNELYAARSIAADAAGIEK